MSRRSLGISILSVALHRNPIVSTLLLLFTKTGLTRAKIFVDKHELKLQLLPLRPGFGLGQRLEHFIHELQPSDVISYEDGWGSWRFIFRKPFEGCDPLLTRIKAALGFCLLFSFSKKVTDRLLASIRERFPEALAVDCEHEGSLIEINPDRNPSPDFWIEQARAHAPMVWDTYHTQMFPSIAYSKLLTRLINEDANFKLIHVQFRDKWMLEEFLSGSECPTRWMLTQLKQHGAIPVVLETTPGLLTDETLQRLIEEIRSVLSA